MNPPNEEIFRYKILLDTARCLGRAMDLRTLINEILDRSKSVMRAEACTLLLPDAHTNDLILHSTDPRLAALPHPLKVPAGQGLAGSVYQSHQSLNIQDAQKDPRHYQGIGKQTGFLTRAILTVPLLDGVQCVGVLQAINPQQRACFDAQDQEILEGFGTLIVTALLRLEAQKRELERAQAQQELVLAREIQESFLPSGIPRFPFANVHLTYLPAQVVGGDFYFLHPIGDHRLLLGLGDVTGRGVPAALTMARATATIRAMVSQLDSDLGVWVELLNAQLTQDLRAGRFIGMTFLLADAKSGVLQICPAGQFAPVHLGAGRWEQVTVANHLPLGISPSAKYTATPLPLCAGDFWLLFSDGIAEARNPRGDEFTVNGAVRELPPDRTAGETMAALIESWKNFVGAAPQHDDASIVLLDWRGMAPVRELALACCLENLASARKFVESWSRYAGFGDVVSGQIVMAADEAVTNIYRHAYRGEPGPVILEAQTTSTELVLQIRDRAPPVAPGQITVRECCEPRAGGLGTFIMSKVFDTVNYAPGPEGTVATLRKRLPS